jgi:RNA polymerase sigma factor (sigma-70 family)
MGVCGESLDFGEWYAGTYRALFVSMLALTGDRELAAEVTDEAFTRALAHWPRVKEMAAPAGWTYRVAVNVLRRTARRRAMERRLLRRAAQPSTAGGPEVELWMLLGGLSERQRLAVVLRYVADLPEDEIASVMGVTRGTVASTLFEARRVLAGVLRDEPVEEERA